MSLEDKLQKWQEAGLIDAATRTRIESFEAAHHRPIVLYALGGLGALTLGIGIVSVVAANWEAITKVQKLGLDLTLGAALAAGLYVCASQARAWQTDVLAGIYYAFVLASIALLGQIYQLGSPTYQALLTWSVCTAPFMLLVRGRLLGLVWLLGLLATYGTSLEAFFDTMARRYGASDRLLANMAATALFASALLFVSVARVPWLLRERPQVSATWTSTLWSLIAAAAFGIGFVWYGDFSTGDELTWGLGAAGVLAFALHALLPRLYPTLPVRARRGTSVLLALSVLTLAAGTTFERPSVEAVGAILQVVVLGVCAFIVLALGQVRAFNVLTGLIALRILVMYFEVFGSMLDTGLGMITGGALTLLLAWVWKRKSPELAARFGAEAGAHVA